MILLANCDVPKIENTTQEWNEHDKQVLEEVKQHCKVFYGENACVRVLKKTGDNRYQVLCYDPTENK